MHGIYRVKIFDNQIIDVFKIYTVSLKFKLETDLHITKGAF